MGLLTLIQIPCHHVLANEIALNLKYRIGFKHFFNINLEIGIIKKTTFLFVFLTYLPVFYSNFDRETSLDAELNSTSNEYPLDILSMDPATPKTRNTRKYVMMSEVFLFLGVVGSVKRMPHVQVVSS